MEETKKFNVVTPLERKKLPAEDANVVLESAKERFESVLILGYTTEGHLEVFSTLDLDPAMLLWMVSVFQKKLIRGDFHEEV